MHESTTIEFKLEPNKTFVKTVSAYANFGTGKIIFGVSDEGKPIGIKHPDEARLTIENTINDALDPRPDYFLETKHEGETALIVLTVYEGMDKPYLASGKAYCRMDTSSVPVDRAELRRLSIEGSPVPYDEMKSSSQNLSFSVLNTCLREAIGIEPTLDTLRTLGLFANDSYCNAAALLSDENNFPGIDLVRYAADETSIHERYTFAGISILSQLECVLNEYRKHYIVEKIDGIQRHKVELIPEVAIREAIANALVHRIWFTEAHIIVLFYPDHIEIVSPGGLPDDLNEELYLEGGVSLPRNTTLAYVFLRLGIIERLGSGIRHIKKSYSESMTKPTFSVGSHAIKVILPIINTAPNLSATETALLNCFKPGLESTAGELEQELNISRAQLIRILSQLMEKGLIRRIGQARATRYTLA